MDQHAFWADKYAAIPHSNPYSKEACNIFPRYRFADETLVNIERTIFSEATLLKEACETLVCAGLAALYTLTKQLNNLKNWKTAVLALEDQLSSYRTFIDSFDPLSGEVFEQLPFRRVLTENEGIALWQLLQGRWGIRGNGWFPLSTDAQPLGSLTFHTDLWNARQGYLLFQQFLTSKEITRCFMLREFGPPDYELDRELAKPFYDGSGIVLFANTDWIIYASHESSLTLAGSVAAYFQEQWSDTEDLAYGGHYSSPDLRGRWK